MLENKMMSDKEKILLISPFDQGDHVNEERVVLGDDDDEDEVSTSGTTSNTKTGQDASSRTVASDEEKDDDLGLGASGDIRREKLRADIDIVAATRALFMNEKANGRIFRDDQMRSLEADLEDRAEDILGDAWDVGEFRVRYQNAIKTFKGPNSMYQDLKSHITSNLLADESVAPEIKSKVEDVIISMRIEIDPVGFEDISDASLDYLAEVFKSFGVFAKDQLSGDILDRSGESCLYSHPYATAFALLSGASSGGLTTGALWSRLLSTVAAPVKAPLKLAFSADRALARTVDRMPFYVGTVSRVTRYGVYGAILAGATGAAAATLALPDDSKELNEYRKLLNKKIDVGVGEIPLGLLPSKLIDIASGLMSEKVAEKTKKLTGVQLDPKDIQGPLGDIAKDVASEPETEKAVKDFVATWSKEQVDSLTSQIPLTRKEIKNAVSAEVINKLNKATSVTQKSKGHMGSLNCYLLTVGGAFALTNLASGPLRSASFSTKVAIKNNWNKLTAVMDAAYTNIRRTRGGLFKLKKGNDLAAYLACKAILQNRTVGRVLGDVKISGKLDGRPTLTIQTSGASGAGPVINDKVVSFSLGHIPEVHHKKLKAFTRERNGTKVIEIDMANANKQLKEEISLPVFEKAQIELSKEVNQVYKTGTTINRIRQLASKVESLNLSPAQVMNRHYKNTATLMTRMMSKTKAGVRVFENSLTEIEKRTKEIRAALKNINISPDEVIAAVKKYEIENPNGPVPNFRLIAKHLPLDVQADKLFRAAVGKSTRTKYDKLIDNILELDTLEKQMITEFKMIDEMFSLEKRMHKKFGGTNALVDIPSNFDDYISGKRGLGNQLVNYSRELFTLYNRFSSHLENSLFSRSGRMLRTGLVKATLLMADVEWAVRRMGPPTMEILRSINLKNINAALQENPKLTAAIAAAGAGSLYNFIDFLINYLSGAIKENASKDDKAKFVEFLKAFKQKTKRIRNPKKAKPWIAWVREFNAIGAVSVTSTAENTGPIKQKMAKLLKLFKDMAGLGKENTLKENRIITMKKTDLRKLVSEVLNENTGMGYSKYPYHSEEYSEDEPDEDYMSEWKMLVDEVCGRKKKNVDGDPSTVEDTAVEVAKLFIKDSDLFREVLELAGTNKSVGREIMNQLKAAKDKTIIDKKPKV